MGIVIDILFAIGMWIVGAYLYSYGVMQILLTLFCSIPLTIRFSKIYDVDTPAIYSRCITTIVLWTVVTAVVIALVMAFGSIYVKFGFWAGFIISFLLSIGKWGINQPNFEDYFQAFRSFYPPKAIDEILGNNISTK